MCVCFFFTIHSEVGEVKKIHGSSCGMPFDVVQACEDVLHWERILRNYDRKEADRMIPKDPVMLLSFINLKLRDYYSSLEKLCDDMEVNEDDIKEKLSGIDYHYDEEKNQFV